jgi:hypothetical protein
MPYMECKNGENSPSQIERCRVEKERCVLPNHPYWRERSTERSISTQQNKELSSQIALKLNRLPQEEVNSPLCGNFGSLAEVFFLTGHSNIRWKVGEKSMLKVLSNPDIVQKWKE